MAAFGTNFGYSDYDNRNNNSFNDKSHNNTHDNVSDNSKRNNVSKQINDVELTCVCDIGDYGIIKQLKQNPHTAQFFCTYDDIYVKQSNIELPKGVKHIKELYNSRPTANNGWSNANNRNNRSKLSNVIEYTRKYQYVKEATSDAAGDAIGDATSANFYVGEDPFLQYITEKNYYNSQLHKTIDKLEYVKYIPRQQMLRSTVHIGQLKLLMIEVEFLVDKLDIKKYNKTHIIYAGTARGSHIIQLATMFPGIKFELIDPNRVDKDLIEFARGHPDINIIEDYFTDEMAQKYHDELIVKQKKNVLMISDIRCGPQASDIMEEEIDRDNVYQANWVRILKPEWAILKFRIPRLPKNKEKPTEYTDHKTTDEINKKLKKERKKKTEVLGMSNNRIEGQGCCDNSQYHDNYEYLDGEVNIQCFAPPSSTETRLVVKKNPKTKTYHLDDYEGKLHYHNRITRAKYYEHNLNIKGFDHCYDCTRTLFIVHLYKEKFIKSKKSSAYASKSLEDIMNDIYTNLKLWYKLKTDIKIM